MNGLKVVHSSEPVVLDMINERVLTYSELAILNQMNKNFAHVVVGGKHQIASKADCTINGTKLVLSSIDSFHNYFTHLPKVAGKNRGRAWAEWPKKSFYNNGIGFYPNTNQLPKGCYNLFEGWSCEPSEGNCSFILNHIEEILCNGNQEAGSYFIKWLAHIFQYPEIKPSVAVFLKSVEGTGKGSLFRLLQKMLGSYSSQINGSDLVTRSFNGILNSKLIIFADEVNLINRDIFDKIKGLISEPTCQLEKKGIETEPMMNLSRFIFASNHEQVIPAGQRERRFLLIEASDKKATDKSYWLEFNRLINNKYAGYFLNYLLKLDLKDFDPYNAPMTRELIDQKIFNFKPVDQYFFEQLVEVLPFGGEELVPAPTLMNQFIEWLNIGEYADINGKKITPPKARSILVNKFKKLGFIKEGKRSDRNGGIVYKIPDTKKLRKSFAQSHGLTVQDLFLSIK